MTQLAVNKNPCATCPYRKDVPSGVWHEDEYEKLRGYDDNTAFAVFLCHYTNVVEREVACKGWVMVHQHSVAVRLARLKGELDHRTCFETPDVELYASGNEAADAGERQIQRPRRKALQVIGRLKQTGRFKDG